MGSIVADQVIFVKAIQTDSRDTIDVACLLEVTDFQGCVVHIGQYGQGLQWDQLCEFFENVTDRYWRGDSPDGKPIEVGNSELKRLIQEFRPTVEKYPTL